MMRYKSGEEIRVGDDVVYDGVPAEVEFVVSDREDDPNRRWYFEQFGVGVILADRHVFGSVFVSGDDVQEDVVFVSRGVDK